MSSHALPALAYSIADNDKLVSIEGLMIHDTRHVRHPRHEGCLLPPPHRQRAGQAGIGRGKNDEPARRLRRSQLGVIYPQPLRVRGLVGHSPPGNLGCVLQRGRR